MPKISKKVNKTVRELFIYVSLIFILLLTYINIENYLIPKDVEVLGAETQNLEEEYWNNLLEKNPDYIPGLIETGRIDKARQVDPNNELVIYN